MKLIALLVLLPSLALATNPPPAPVPDPAPIAVAGAAAGATSGSVSGAASRSASDSHSASAATVGDTTATGGAGGAGGAGGVGGAGGLGGAGGDSDAAAESSSGGNVMTSTEIHRRAPVSTAVAVAGVNTLRCVKTGAVGLQLVGIGGSISLPRTDRDCKLENAADREYHKGNKTAGDRLTCMTSYMLELYPDSRLCMAGQNELVAVERTDGTGHNYVPASDVQVRKIEEQKAQTRSGK